ncbi:MAG: MerR family transcriptional regulator [Candidatus Glassbacteria bacterium]
MATKKAGELYTAGKLAQELNVPQGKVKKLIEARGIKPDEVKRGCRYYGAATLQKLKAAIKET